MYRERFNDPGWVCDGTGLVKLTDVGGIPVVAPQDRLDEMRKVEELWAAFDEPVPFSGGDHYHLVLF